MGIYWDNHHAGGVPARVRRGAVGEAAPVVLAVAVPFAAAWMGENHFAGAPVAAYGVVLLMAAIAYWLLQ